MFIFKKKPSLAEADIEKLKKFVGNTIEAMLLTKEETLNISERYKLVLVYSWGGDYMEGSIFQWSSFQLSEKGLRSLTKAPLYTAKHYFNKKNNSIEHIDDKEIKAMSHSELLLFNGLCNLIQTFEVEVNSSNHYCCVWK